MARAPKAWLNPYIVGQLTLLLGGIALGLTVLPPQVIKADPVGSTTVKTGEDSRTAVEQRVKSYRTASLVLAAVGLCLGPIGWMRERPPLLPIAGMALCVLAIFWHWILAVAVVLMTVFILLKVAH